MPYCQILVLLWIWYDRIMEGKGVTDRYEQLNFIVYCYILFLLV